ncbi:hypothetical protein CKO28_18815 [Rhodovibrio sodomensis]|uniref:MotA/TolQ/ExbB proton channel domain-containing protein n=1 Tax=Rhodovibrio sodomensis TaxID=1088 RepID=A0ABS1DJB2_9PROT|nr:hypothetical protein [Rhodovibrio sodomensis]MBK1670091.1 hypothetical protein [Rhodovibrio sodomensis]
MAENGENQVGGFPCVLKRIALNPVVPLVGGPPLTTAPIMGVQHVADNFGPSISIILFVLALALSAIGFFYFFMGNYWVLRAVLREAEKADPSFQPELPMPVQDTSEQYRKELSELLGDPRWKRAAAYGAGFALVVVASDVSGVFADSSTGAVAAISELAALVFGSIFLWKGLRAFFTGVYRFFDIVISYEFLTETERALERRDL